MKPASWPRYMREKSLADGRAAYYWSPQIRDLRNECPVRPEALGFDYAAAVERSNFLNLHLDAWRGGREISKDLDLSARFGTVGWWIERYKRTDAFKMLSARSREDYEEALRRLSDLQTELIDAKTGSPVRVGTLPVGSLSAGAVDKLYAMLRIGGVTRQANYPIDVARRAWKVVARLYPGEFLTPNPSSPRERIALNPFAGVDRVYGDGTTEPASREEAYALAHALAEIGHPAVGAAALVCFEWLQRPENVLSGAISWNDYRPAHHPNHARIEHWKTKKMVWQPLQDNSGPLYPEIEAYLASVPRLGVPIVLLDPQRGARSTTTGKRTPRLYSLEHARHLVQTARHAAGLPSHVTLAACRHGGMTELGNSDLTEQQIMALSTHATPDAARVYVKRTELQRLAAARKRRDFIARAGDVPRRVADPS